ncbi:MAG: 23S rRNA (pseudouridine(1915)-N(3))-methyltransferase RlmH [Bacteroidales bacterium]|nr:23S rRNA (pseudouridine(1915)-N(3))-methyltransferase RlmH [Candidatus Colicola caccequi]MCQ2328531.1 23S rRNA (pseudouridine(1915)-N(3))-methyltransferase RlmH [Paludibacteraceae bacterium]
MKVTLLVVGKTTDKHLEVLIEDYVERIGHYLPFEIKVIPELKNVKALSQAQQKTMEGELILKAVGTTEVILLDEHGKERRSIEFADWMNKKMSAGRDLTFVIGGPFGFSEAVYQRAEGQISLSLMTFSHQMIRLLFTEQMYRALTIIRGEKYHHE